jgi:hypothetical protein
MKWIQLENQTMAELWAVKLGLEMVWKTRSKLLPSELDFLHGYLILFKLIFLLK